MSAHVSDKKATVDWLVTPIGKSSQIELPACVGIKVSQQQFVYESVSQC